ncbi:MAG TPA: hypothetical protein VFD58_12525 [Blastocatellia bacterium]|nr:hypothetical protein [Blastocatellia bacterium]
MKDMCINCAGTGEIACEHCGGVGQEPEASLLDQECHKCRGTGKENCPECRGSGLIELAALRAGR